MVRSADSAPTADGVNVTVIVQLAPIATALPQLLATPKSVLFGPASCMLEIAKLADPVFVTLTVAAGLVCPITTLPKATELGLTTTLGVPVPIPDALIDVGEPG